MPANFRVVRHVRAKLSCTKCDCIVQAEAPSRPIDRGLAGPALLAQVCPTSAQMGQCEEWLGKCKAKSKKQSNLLKT